MYIYSIISYNKFSAPKCTHNSSIGSKTAIAWVFKKKKTKTTTSDDDNYIAPEASKLKLGRLASHQKRAIFKLRFVAIDLPGFDREWTLRGVVAYEPGFGESGQQLQIHTVTNAPSTNTNSRRELSPQS